MDKTAVNTPEIRYNSAWGGLGYSLVAVGVLTGWLMCAVLDYGVVGVVIGALMALSLILPLAGTYYKVSGDELIVYCGFFSQAYPIGKIKEIKPTRSILSAPAVSIRQRIAITFVDRKVMKSSSPLVISPVRRAEFISRLVAVNPDIKVEDCV